MWTASVGVTEDGGLVDLGTFKGGTDSQAQIVSEDGTIIGFSEARGKQRRAFAWTSETGMVELPSLGGTFEEVIAANANGVLAGISSFKKVKGSTDEHPVIWTPSSARRETLK